MITFLGGEEGFVFGCWVYVGGCCVGFGILGAGWKIGLGGMKCGKELFDDNLVYLLIYLSIKLFKAYTENTMYFHNLFPPFPSKKGPKRHFIPIHPGTYIAR